MKNIILFYRNKHRGGPLSDPVLICDLPGHNQSPETNSNHPSSASGTCKSPTSASSASASTTSASTASGTARTASATESRDHEEDANWEDKRVQVVGRKRNIHTDIF